MFVYSSGYVSVVGELDYETSRSYFLTVQARDHGTPSLSGTAIVRVNLTDSNDNEPVFTQRKYIAMVKEDSPLRYNVVQVSLVCW